MKKLLSVVVVFVMLVAMSVSVFADTVAPTTTYDAEEGNWTTSGTNAAYANSMMTVVAVTGQPISVSSIQYIDQTTADANGAYSFAGYLPKADPAEGVEYLVFVGGQKLAAPIEAGKIYYVASQGGAEDVVITGVVTKAGNITGATVALLNAQGENVVDPVTADPTSGEFSITAPAGTYTLKITKPGHTKYIYNNVDISGLTAGATYALYSGDATGDNYVGINDVIEVISNLKTKPSELTDEAEKSAAILVDVTDDDYIGINDVIAVISNLKAKGIVLPVPEA